MMRVLTIALLFTVALPGQVFGIETRVNSDASSAYQGYSACAAAPDGRLLVVWEDARSGGNDIYMQRFSRDGSPLGANVRVNDSISPEQYSPAVVADPTGVFWVVWQDFRASG